MFKKFFLLAAAILSVCIFPVYADDNNIARNSSFEEGAKQLSYWEEECWNTSGVTEFKWETGKAHSGDKFITIINNAPNHSRYKQAVNVKPNKIYKISCWIMAENIPEGNIGAGITVRDVALVDKGLKDTGGKWEYYEIFGKTGLKQNTLEFSASLGGYGSINTGKASFDDFAVSEINDIPSGAKLYNFYNNPATINNTIKSTPSNDLFGKLSTQQWTLLATIVLLIYLGIAIFYLFYNNKEFETGKPVKSRSKNTGKTRRNISSVTLKTNELQYKKYLLIIIGIGVLLRIIIAPLYRGYYFDYRMFWYWSDEAVKNLFGIYLPGKVYVDYPPVYIIVLYVVGIINRILHFASGSGLSIVMFKLPSIIAEAFTAYIIYRLASKRVSEKFSLILAALYLFNPAIWFDSVVWGQVDSVFMLAIIGMLFLISEKKLWLAAVVLGVAIMMKPQGFIFGPVLFFEMLKSRDIKKIITTILAGFGTVFAIALPFTIGNTDKLWLYKLLFKMTGTWNFASVNAFNFFALAGANWKEDFNRFIIFSYKSWGDMFLVLVVLFTAFLYYKSKSNILLYFGALILNAGTFCLSSRMHERYLYPALILTLFIFIQIKEKKWLYLFLGITITNLFNIFLSFINIASSGSIDQYASIVRIYPTHWMYPIVSFISLLNVTMLILIVKYSIDVLLKNATGDGSRLS